MDRYKYHIYTGLVSFFLFLLRIRLSKTILSNSVSVTPKTAATGRPGVGDCFYGIIRSGATDASRYARVVDKILKVIERVNREESQGIY
jgi:hypothetical protein